MHKAADKPDMRPMAAGNSWQSMDVTTEGKGKTKAEMKVRRSKNSGVVYLPGCMRCQ